MPFEVLILLSLVNPLRQGNYRVDNEAGDADPHVIDLNTNLNACDDCTSASLPEAERRFIFEGLGTLMEHLLISNARYIRFANKTGIQKIFRNILALQQNMRTLSDLSEDAQFARARRYYDMFFMTPPVCSQIHPCKVKIEVCCYP